MTAPTKAPTKRAPRKPMPAASTKTTAPGKGKPGPAGTAAAPASTATAPASRLIPLEQIHTHPDQPRGELTGIEDLRQTIEQVGLLQRPVVEEHGGGYAIVAGHRRIAALRQLGWAEVWCDVREPDKHVLGAMLVENDQRVGLNALEEARAYQQLVDDGLSQHQIAARVGRNQSHISKRLALLALPDELTADVVDGKVSIGDALAVAPIARDLERVRKVLDNRPTWQLLKDAVDVEVRAIEKSDTAAKLTADAKAEGRKVIKAPGWYSDSAEKVWVKDLRNTGRLGKSALHEGLPCHALAVRTDLGAVHLEEVCTKASTHRDTRRSAADTAREADVAARARRGAIRQDLVRDVLRGSGTPGLETYVLEVLVGELTEKLAYRGYRRWAVEALGLPADEDADLTPDVLLEFVRVGACTGTQLVAALAIATREARHDKDGYWVDVDKDRQHHDFLLAHGLSYDDPTLHDALGTEPATRLPEDVGA